MPNLGAECARVVEGEGMVVDKTQMVVHDDQRLRVRRRRELVDDPVPRLRKLQAADYRNIKDFLKISRISENIKDFPNITE